MLNGYNPIALDSKGRVAIPARYRDYFREACGGRVTVTLSFDMCLLVYPINEWRTVQEKVAALSDGVRRNQNFKRLLLGHAEECDLDGQGRLLISSALRKRANLGRRVALVGMGNKFELWDEEVWNGQFDDMVASARDATAENGAEISY